MWLGVKISCRLVENVICSSGTLWKSIGAIWSMIRFEFSSSNLPCWILPRLWQLFVSFHDCMRCWLYRWVITVAWLAKSDCLLMLYIICYWLYNQTKRRCWSVSSKFNSFVTFPFRFAQPGRWKVLILVGYCSVSIQCPRLLERCCSYALIAWI